MATLYKRATPQQVRILRIVEGAVRNALDAHPDVAFPDNFARSVAKRAAGTLTAQWRVVLAAHTPSDDGSEKILGISDLTGAQLVKLSASRAQVNKPLPRGAVSTMQRRSPLIKVWKALSGLVGQMKKQGQLERAQGLIDALRLIDDQRKGGR
jgi:hypothetical protein